MTIVSGLTAAASVLLLMLATGTRHVAIDRGRLGRNSAPLSLFGQVRVRPPVGSVCHPLVRALGHDRGVRHQVHAPRARLQPVLRALRTVRAGHGGDLARRHDRDVVRRLGAGRALVGAAGRIFSGAARSGAERALGLDRSTASRTHRSCWRRWSCTTCGAKEISTCCWDRAHGPMGSRP